MHSLKGFYVLQCLKASPIIFRSHTLVLLSAATPVRRDSHIISYAMLSTQPPRRQYWDGSNASILFNSIGARRTEPPRSARYSARNRFRDMFAKLDTSVTQLQRTGYMIHEIRMPLELVRQTAPI